jgi:putative ABC transport system permease protein
MNTKLIKAYRDLLARKGPTFVMILALSIGIIGAGSIFNAYNIMVREMQKNYDMTNPPHFIIKKENLSGDERQRIAGLSSEYKYEYRGIIEGRMLTPSGIWKPIVLEVVPDFNQVQINQFFTLKEEKYQSLNNQNSPGLMEVFIEKAAFPEAEQNIGNNMKILLPDSPIQEVKITGSYHAPALPPAWMENCVYGFISMETAQKLGFKDPLNRILVQSPNTIKTFQDAKNESVFFVEKIKNLGITDFTTEVPLPGVHPHAGQMNSFLYLLQVFGVIALIMASALTGNIISSILARQKREIGIMKSIGADRGQVLLILLIQIGIVGLIALLIAMPLARIIAVQYSYFTANILNFIIYDASIPLWSYALQIVIGLGIPLLMSLVPILRNSKITVREIITDYGINSQSRKKSWFKMPVIPGLTPYILSIRNTFRQKGRFVLMLVTLTVSGVLFLISQNVSQSINVTVEDIFKLFR